MRRLQSFAPWCAAGGAGIALALALPGMHLWPLAIVFPILMLSALSTELRVWRACALGWFAGIVHWCISASWVISVMHDFGGLHLAMAVLCLMIMAAILGLFWALASVLTVLVRPRLRLLAFPIAWVLCDALRQFPPLLFPWNSFASTLSDQPALLGSLPSWGATGVSWAVIAIVASLWGLLRPGMRRLASIQLAVTGLLLTLATILAVPPQTTGKSFWIALVQPGTSLEERWQPSMWQEVAQRVWKLSRQAAGADLILWPEGSVPFVVESDPLYRQQLQDLASELQADILLNSMTVEGQQHFNSAYLATPEGVSKTRYDKMRLVPFGEYVPAWARLAFTEALVREVASFSPGTTPALLPGPAPIGVAICYEIIFADLVAKQVRSGAQIIATITNDGWYGDSWAPKQHFAQAILRAVESRRWVVRAGLTGISAAIDPRGTVTSRLDVGESGIIVTSVDAMQGLTLRSRLGDWWTVILVLALLALLTGDRRFSRRTS